MLTTLTPPCQKCYKPAMETRGGGDCVDCNKFFCENDSIKIKVGEVVEEDKSLYGVICKECEAKRLIKLNQINEKRKNQMK